MNMCIDIYIHIHVFVRCAFCAGGRGARWRQGAKRNVYRYVYIHICTYIHIMYVCMPYIYCVSVCPCFLIHMYSLLYTHIYIDMYTLNNSGQPQLGKLGIAFQASLSARRVLGLEAP